MANTSNDRLTYLTSKEVAAILHVQVKSVGRWAREGRLPFTLTLGGHRRFPEAAIRELAATLRVEATQ